MKIKKSLSNIISHENIIIQEIIKNKYSLQQILEN